MEGVVMGCREPHRGVVGAVARVGAVRFGCNWASRRAFRHAGVCCWWAGGLRRCHGVVTSGAKHGGTQGDTLRRLVQVNGGEGRSGTGKHGFSLTGGQVVAGSNPVSPTTVSPTKEKPFSASERVCVSGVGDHFGTKLPTSCQGAAGLPSTSPEQARAGDPDACCAGTAPSACADLFTPCMKSHRAPAMSPGRCAGASTRNVTTLWPTSDRERRSGIYATASRCHTSTGTFPEEPAAAPGSIGRYSRFVSR